MDSYMHPQISHTPSACAQKNSNNSVKEHEVIPSDLNRRGIPCPLPLRKVAGVYLPFVNYVILQSCLCRRPPLARRRYTSANSNRGCFSTAGVSPARLTWPLSLVALASSRRLSLSLGCASRSMLSRRRNEDARFLARARLWADRDLHIAIERGQEMHQALDGESFEPVIRKRGNLRLIDFQSARCGRLRQILAG